MEGRADATLSRGADAAYREALIERLGGRDPFETLASLFESLPDAIEGLGPEALAAPEGEGKWSIRDVIQHLADTELVQAWRIRRIVTEEEPVLHGIDQDVWAGRLRYERATLTGALDQLRSLRSANLRLLRALSDEELERAGRHEERGRESLRTMVALLAGHDLVHLDQIARIRGRVGVSGDRADGPGEGADGPGEGADGPAGGADGP